MVMHRVWLRSALPLPPSIRRTGTIPSSSSSSSRVVVLARSARLLPQQQQICWFCSARAEPTDELQFPVEKDAFRLFDLPYKFMIDHEALRSTYREFMKDLHPDRQHMNHNPSSTTAAAAAVVEPAVVTDAYDTLKRPHLRATHLLQVLGHPMDEDAAVGSMQLVGDAFLMEIMRIREDIENAATDDAALKPLLDQNLQRIEETCHKLDVAFEAQNMPEALQLTAQLQYWNRIDETLREAMDSLE
jgi:molecular chaperone HscB